MKSELMKSELGTYEVGTHEVGTHEIGTREIGTHDVGTHEHVNTEDGLRLPTSGVHLGFGDHSLPRSTPTPHPHDPYMWSVAHVRRCKVFLVSRLPSVFAGRGSSLVVPVDRSSGDGRSTAQPSGFPRFTSW